MARYNLSGQIMTLKKKNAMVLGLLVMSPTSGLTGTWWNLAIKAVACLNYF
jgi:hypothetical protein